MKKIQDGIQGKFKGRIEISGCFGKRIGGKEQRSQRNV